jgi:neutral ceramidase
MAGRRLRTTVLDATSVTGISHVALGTYANEYAQYITTPEEYSSQRYEGASTLFGPHTLEAHQQVVAELATAIAHGKPTAPGPPPTPWTSTKQRSKLVLKSRTPTVCSQHRCCRLSKK